ncbi:hypothetical protein [Vibrio vulnificus]|uniref:hypothetical protein n=1 Tax=Vibrio vulnificus TaxID=672 RepID=UPI00102A89B1|nr:hypothetical protein [Vibrio vulnificus]MCU8191575.1 hypothetical protein [Vibrio vulnificus]MDS1839060.1 hypothetical protein [Vibrio vulnificus]MDS1847688.1 hypothetical protein [Vibrio vulnificus]RZQ22124.1 hypothetical protein D8T40_13670 [Vibrio vulnificus]
MNIPKVFLDTNIIKFSSSELERYVPYEQEISWGGSKQRLVVHQMESYNPNDNIKNEKLKCEVDLLEAVSKLGNLGQLQFLTHAEVQFESWNMPNLDSKRGIFYGASVSLVEDPIQYFRTIMGGAHSLREYQYSFLSSVKHPRFIEIQKVVGAYQGETNPPSRNQLLDAFHLWCAENSKCDYFLTLDMKLIKIIRRKTNNCLTVKAIKPSELLEIVV